MITIVAEKPDVGNKIAAALDKITLSGGKTISFSQLKANEKAVKSQQAKDGYLKIKYDGQDCYVTWGYGHLCELKQAVDYNPAYKSWSALPLPFIVPKYEIHLRKDKDPKWAARTKSQFNTVKDLINKSDYVINATDLDREGEVIFAYIYEVAKCKKPVKRACFNSQTQSGIQDGFKKMKTGAEMKPIEEAGRMRGIADWVVGANLTVAMSLKNPGQGILSVGRVQTPTLALVVEKELAIRDFKKVPYYALTAEFTTPSGDVYTAKYKKEKIENKADADAILAKIDGKYGIVTDIQKKTVTKEAPLLYSLSALQMDANSKLGLTLKQTLEIAQELYDGGYTTYPRTNSQYLTEDMEPVVNGVLDKISKVPDYEKLISGKPRKFNFKHYFNDSKVESHFAIIPTGNIPSGLSEKAQKVYDLICRSVIKMLYGPATLEQTKVITTVEGEEFNASGSVIVNAGWMTVGDASKTELLPSLTIGDECFGMYEVKEKETEPPKRYTDKTLLAAMLTAGKLIDDADLRKVLSDPKTGGIGTEATRAAIVETLLARNYIERNGKTLAATDKGIYLIQSLPLDEVKSPELTAKWEQRLNDIARKTESSEEFRKDIEAAVIKWVKEIDVKVAKVASTGTGGPTTSINCPVCGKPLLSMKWGFGCSGYKDGCKFSVGTICGKKISETQVKTLVEKGKTSLMKGFVSKAGKKFDAYLKLESDGKIVFEFPPR